MPIVLPFPLSTPEMRVLQEFRRLEAETLSADVIRAIKHPVGGGDAPAISLAAKGFLVAKDGGESYSLTEQGRGFLSIDHVPKPSAGSGGTE